MKKIKNLIKYLILSFTIITIACNSDENNTPPIVSEQDIDEKISYVNSVNNRLDKELEKSFLEEQLKERYFINDRLSKEEKLLQGVKNYHKKLLLKIEKSRKELNLTSIQSIADEINSLFVLNKEKAEKLFEKNKHFFDKGKFGVTPKISKDLASVLDVNTDLLNDELDNNYSRRGSPEYKKEGILGTTDDGLFAITWHVSTRGKNGIFLNPHHSQIHRVMIGSFIKLNGNYILYPSIKHVLGGSGFEFRNLPSLRSIYVSFKSTGWTNISINETKTYETYNDLRTGYIKGEFSTIINGKYTHLSIDTVEIGL